MLERGTEYEVELAKSYLASLNIPSNILSKRDSSYSLNIGEMSMVYLYVPEEYEKKARTSLHALDYEEPDINHEPDEEDAEESGGDSG